MVSPPLRRRQGADATRPFTAGTAPRRPAPSARKVPRRPGGKPFSYRGRRTQYRPVQGNRPGKGVRRVFRNSDLIGTCLADKRLLVTKLNFYAQQVTDPSLRSLLQDCANVQNRHVQILTQAQSRVGVTSPQIQPQPGAVPGAGRAYGGYPT